MASNQLNLEYWALRGLAEPIRTLFEYLGTSYKEEKYQNFEQWVANKTSKFSRFPNLPCLVDEVQVVTETEAIYTYIIIKSDKPELLGKPEDKIEFFQIKGNINDFNNGVTEQIFSSKEQEEMKKKIEEYMKEQGSFKLEGLSETLGQKEWLLGYISWLDFNLAELIERFSQLDEEVGTRITADYPNLVAHYKRFLEIPEVKAYRQSDRFQARPHYYISAS